MDMLFRVLQSMFFFILHVTGPGSFPKPLSAKDEKKYLLEMKEGKKVQETSL